MKQENYTEKENVNTHLRIRLSAMIMLKKSPEKKNLICTHKVIEQMPEQRRNVYILSRDKGQSNKEIADQLSLSPTTVRNHLTLALQSLKRALMVHYDMEPGQSHKPIVWLEDLSGVSRYAFPAC